MSSYAALRASQGNSLEKLNEKLEKLNGGGGNPTLEDETFWTIDHVRGKDGTGHARVRLLPAPPGEDDEFIELTEYIFQGPSGQWYINYSRMNLGSTETDPVFKYNGKLFADRTLTDEERKKKLLGRKQGYVVGIQVLEDPNRPENEGKVFRWKIGPQIWGVIQGAMKPKFADQKPVNPFDPIDGADFILRVYTKEIGNKKMVPSYENSVFDRPSALVKDPADFDAIWNKQHSLIKLREKIKPLEELQARFDLVMELGPKNIMDSDEPIRRTEKVAAKTASAPKTLAQELDDSIPYDGSTTVEETKTVTQSAEVFDAGDDAWFNELKKGQQ